MPNPHTLVFEGGDAPIRIITADNLTYKFEITNPSDGSYRLSVIDEDGLAETLAEGAENA